MVSLVFREVDRERFEEVRNAIKKIETRAGTEKYRAIQVGDSVEFVCGDESFEKTVVKTYWWPSAEEMLKEIRLQEVMPDLTSIEEVQKRYASYPDYEQKIKQHGIVGFELK